MNSKKVSVVIPIYNERDNIIKLLEEVLKVIDSQAGDEIILIDEVLTPDSSRFWKKDDYLEGNSPNPYDKQFLRDWLNQQDWNKTPPPPSIPNEVINNTLGRYLEIYELLTNDKLNI